MAFQETLGPEAEGCLQPFPSRMERDLLFLRTMDADIAHDDRVRQMLKDYLTLGGNGMKGMSGDEKQPHLHRRSNSLLRAFRWRRSL